LPLFFGCWAGSPTACLPANGTPQAAGAALLSFPLGELANRVVEAAQGFPDRARLGIARDFDFETHTDDEQATRNRLFAQQMRANARQAALDPDDRMEL
jgi:hypothetical protein